MLSCFCDEFDGMPDYNLVRLRITFVPEFCRAYDDEWGWALTKFCCAKFCCWCCRFLLAIAPFFLLLSTTAFDCSPFMLY